MPHDLGKTYVIVNLPDFTLRVMHDGKQVWMTKIVDGKPTTPTPIMSAEMKYITVNPTWNVPPSIVANEYLPLLQQDPTILARMGLSRLQSATAPFTFRSRPARTMRSAGCASTFPNKFLVYQHELQREIPVLRLDAGRQPRLHAGPGSGEIRRGAARTRARRAKATRRSASAGCSATARWTSSFRLSSRCT